MTVMELLLALGITAMVGAAVLAMLLVVAVGSEQNEEARRRNATARVISERIDAEIRSATAVLASDEHMLVLWMGDRRQNQKPNLSELRRIEWDPDSRQIRRYAAPADLAEADDTEYELSQDFAAITASLNQTPGFVGQTWAHEAAAWRISPAGAGADTRLIQYELILGDAPSATIASTVSLRGR
jgi:type II secretory pathway component PulJ